MAQRVHGAKEWRWGEEVWKEIDGVVDKVRERKVRWWRSEEAKCCKNGWRNEWGVGCDATDNDGNRYKETAHRDKIAREEYDKTEKMNRDGEEDMEEKVKRR